MSALGEALYDWTDAPPFDRIEIAEIEPAIRHVLSEAEAAVAAVEAVTEPSWDSVMVPIEQAMDQLGRSWGLVGHLMSVQNSDELREVHERLQGDVVAFGSRVGQSSQLFAAYTALRESPDWDSWSSARQRILTAELKDAELSGVGLEGEARERFTANQARLAQLSTSFSNHLLDATKAWEYRVADAAELEGLPSTARSLLAANARARGDEDASAADGPWVVTLDQPCVMAVLQHAANRGLRERVYRAFVTRASEGELDNAPVISEILKLRREQAVALGYANFADMALSKRMASDVGEVRQLLEELFSASRPAAERELEELRAFVAEQGASEADDLAQWDIGFWAERLREARYELNDEELRPYFPLPRVLDGLFALVERLFGVRIAAADGAVPVWHEDVRFFRVFRGDEQIAACYLDPYSRPAEKRPGAWMNDCVGRSAACAPEGQAVRLPVAYLVCNQTPPVDGKPSLMTFREVETLFHEFGHALQHMLTTVDEGMCAGIANVEWDAVELPSQFMENWCYHEPVLTGMARHYETGAPLPQEFVERIQRARVYRAGSMFLRQLNFGFTDLALYAEFDPNGDESPFALAEREAQRCSVIPPLPEDRFLCGFAHIFAGGYAAGYYSYKWAEVLSADAFAAFEDVGLDNEAAVAELGRKFADTVLALGGSQHPTEVFTAFRGREPNTEPLLRHNGLS